MDTKFRNLLPIQREVNRVVIERLEEKGMEKPNLIDFLIAMHVEFFEFINAVGVWKWWKHSHTIDKVKVLDELADIMAFYLSIMDIAKEVEDTSDEIISATEEMISDFETNDLIASVSLALQTGEQPMDMSILMGIAIDIARREVDATWEEIAEAYSLKSQENISRQNRGY